MVFFPFTWVPLPYSGRRQKKKKKPNKVSMKDDLFERISGLLLWIKQLLKVSSLVHPHISVNICLLKVNNSSARIICKISSKLTIKTTERLQWSFWCFTVNYGHISHIFLLFLLLNLSSYLFAEMLLWVCRQATNYFKCGSVFLATSGVLHYRAKINTILVERWQSEIELKGSSSNSFSLQCLLFKASLQDGSRNWFYTFLIRNNCRALKQLL